jgi:hypothetical protein
MTSAIRLRGPADIIAVLPYHLGYRPTDSLVVVCLRGRRLTMVARLDLPLAVTDPWAAIEELVPRVQQEQPKHVVLVAFETDEGKAERVSAAMRDALLDDGVEVVDRLVVRAGRWWSLDCTGACCPPEGQPVPLDEDVPAVADYVLLGRRPAANRAELVSRLAPAHTAGMADRCATLAAELDSALRDGGRRVVASRRASLSEWGELLDVCADSPPKPLSDESCARLAVSLRDVTLRDLVIAWTCPGTLGLDVFDASVVDLADRCLPPHGEDVLQAPEERFRAHNALTERLAELCRRVPVELSPPPLAVLASFTWWLGDGALTRVALDRALAVDADYRLARLLERMVDLAIRPRRAA